MHLLTIPPAQPSMFPLRFSLMLPDILHADLPLVLTLPPLAFACMNAPISELLFLTYPFVSMPIFSCSPLLPSMSPFLRRSTMPSVSILTLSTPPTRPVFSSQPPTPKRPTVGAHEYLFPSISLKILFLLCLQLLVPLRDSLSHPFIAGGAKDLREDAVHG